MRLRRVIVRGTTGSGKSTLARALSDITGVEHVQLDAHFHLPGWNTRPQEEFADIVSEIAQRESWILDGNYGFATDPHLAEADAVVWLDYAFPIVFARLFKRTLVRSLKKEELWAGNRESLRKSFLSRESILLWMIKTHRWRRKKCRETKRQLEGTDTQFVHLTSPLDTQLWLASLNGKELS